MGHTPRPGPLLKSKRLSQLINTDYQLANTIAGRFSWLESIHDIHFASTAIIFISIWLNPRHQKDFWEFGIVTKQLNPIK